MRILYNPRLYEVAAVSILVGGILYPVWNLVDLLFFFTGASLDSPTDILRASASTIFTMPIVFMGTAVCIGVAKYLRSKP